ncbi:CSEP0202 putative effector protein [Blumeria hordei DH14]|uniref:CSEP0202 putative effector protein n=1 Tax=Blumeria graminis f. sp. hordei (strain DH14) TaxID=546991 RepID=N1JPQ6_BLUG1|nr:CSEP0202 putative effector protein [Blumeria hordei DH14]
MRLTSLAVILQSASFFVTTFAVLTKRHVNEEDKGFNCDGREIWHEEYSRVDKLQLTGQATPMGLTLDNIYLNLLGNQAVDTTVTFGERENGGRRFSELITLWQRYLRRLLY